MTRAEAKSVGARTYFTGNPCKQGHISERTTINGTCIECGNAACQRWGAKNHARRLRYYAEYRAQTVDQRSAWGKVYRAANAEAVKKRAADWNAANKPLRREYARETAHKRRAAKNSGRNDLSRQDIAELVALQKGRCACCREQTKLTLDHITALSRGGENTRSNAQMLCKPCNLSKGAKHPIEFAQSRGLLL